MIWSTSLMKNSEKSFLNLTLFHSSLKCFSHISNLSFSLNLLNFLIAALNHSLLFKISFYSVFHLIFELLIAECDHKKSENLKNQKKEWVFDEFWWSDWKNSNLMLCDLKASFRILHERNWPVHMFCWLSHDVIGKLLSEFSWKQSWCINILLTCFCY